MLQQNTSVDREFQFILQADEKGVVAVKDRGQLPYVKHCQGNNLPRCADKEEVNTTYQLVKYPSKDGGEEVVECRSTKWKQGRDNNEHIVEVHHEVIYIHRETEREGERKKGKT